MKKFLSTIICVVFFSFDMFSQSIIVSGVDGGNMVVARVLPFCVEIHTETECGEYLITRHEVRYFNGSVAVLKNGDEFILPLCRFKKKLVGSIDN